VHGTLSECDLAPATPIGEFIDLAGRGARNCKVVATIIDEGAASIRSWVGHRDASAPTDLLRATQYAKKNATELLAAINH
jgi:hypothetical protein